MAAYSTVVLIRGRRVAYQLSGDPAGEPLLIVRGAWGGPASTLWSGPRLRWQAPMNGIQLILYDRRCAGGSSYDDADFTLADLAGDIVNLLDYLQINQATIAATSAGGPIALRTALDHRDRVKRLALLSTGMALLHPDPPWLPEPCSAFAQDRLATVRRRLDLLALAGQLGFEAAVRATEDEWRQVPPRPACSPAETLEFENRAKALQALTFPVLVRLASGAIRNMRVQANVDLAPELDRIACPVKIWHAADDTVVPFEFGNALARRIPHAELVRVDSAVHGLIDEPDIQRGIADWMRRR